MENTEIIIRQETPSDYREVEELVRSSFWNVYRPGCLEHYVLKRLRDDADFVPELSLVMTWNGRIIGQNCFVRAEIGLDEGGTLPILTMGPICITNERKRQGLGKLLLDDSLARAKAWGCGGICFEGNILFYGKSGFRFAREYGLRYHGLPEGADDSFFLGQELIPGYFAGIAGTYQTPQGYFVCEREAEAFSAYEAAFPQLEKKVMPGQLTGHSAE